jgi:hypothetical protein
MNKNSKKHSPVVAWTYLDKLHGKIPKKDVPKGRIMNSRRYIHQTDTRFDLMYELDLLPKIEAAPPLSYWIYDKGDVIFWIASNKDKRVIINASDCGEDHEILERLYDNLYTFKGNLKPLNK